MGKRKNFFGDDVGTVVEKKEVSFGESYPDSQTASLDIEGTNETVDIFASDGNTVDAETRRREEEEDAQTDRIKQKIASNKDVVQGDIEAAMERGERLDALEAQSGELAGAAEAFSKESKAAQWRVWWRKMRIWFILGGVFLAVLIITGISLML
ncbi:MAG: synaptobrevin domain containing protein [Amphiamblys sp. WSBS2006]|nr:MAG: synaptobrevin domain containing protein [Amphiamblys sp. WSBS2006]